MNKSLTSALLTLMGAALLAACGQANTEAVAGNDGDKLEIAEEETEQTVYNGYLKMLM